MGDPERLSGALSMPRATRVLGDLGLHPQLFVQQLQPEIRHPHAQPAAGVSNGRIGARHVGTGGEDHDNQDEGEFEITDERDGNDGDSFGVQCGRSKFIVRLYFVDSPETTAGKEGDRLSEQMKYFGATLEDTLSAGHRANELAHNVLGGAFVVQTKKASAPGRSSDAMTEVRRITPTTISATTPRMVSRGNSTTRRARSCSCATSSTTR